MNYIKKNNNSISNLYERCSKIIIVGVSPPPIGGVSIHCSRLYHLLKEQGYDVDLFDLSSFTKYKYEKEIRLYFKLLFGKYDIIHNHSNDYKVNKIILFISKIKKYQIYLTVHNPRLFSKPKWELKFFRKYIKQLDKLILVSNTIFDEYKKNNMIFPEQVIIKNAYIPPVLREEPEIIKTYNDDLNNFVEARKPLLIANASIIMFKDGIDLYGLDMCIELVKKMKVYYKNIGLIFALANDKEHADYLMTMNRKIRDYNINENIYILTGQKQIWPLFRKVDLMVRPTYSDGFPISTVEAIELGCPVLASDCAERHKEIMLFKNRSDEDLFKKCISILEGHNNEN